MMSAPVGSDGKALPHSFDGRFWATEFCRLYAQSDATDVEFMHTWFANAIMAGFDEAKRQVAPLHDRMVSALRMAYLKHHLDDTSIGWHKLDDLLHTLICQVMGDQEFQKWFAEQQEKRMQNSIVHPLPHKLLIFDADG